LQCDSGVRHGPCAVARCARPRQRRVSVLAEVTGQVRAVVSRRHHRSAGVGD
jgi:hypothetical protein